MQSGESSTRASVYAGAIVHRPASAASVALVNWVFTVLQEELRALDPRMAFGADDNGRFFQGYTGLRTALPGNPSAREAVAALLREDGSDPSDTWVDGPRLRAVTPWGHHLADAAPAYAVHRDTWFGNPSTQVNHWLALHDTAAEDAVALYPSWFARAVPNSSAQFDLAEWMREGGFQSVTRSRHHPTVVGDVDLGPAWQRPMRAGERLLFSAAHLHGTLPNRGRRIRFSVEIRTVHRGDFRCGRGANDVDSRARGSTLSGMWRLDDPQAVVASS
jgi:hypothetical protein